MMSLFPHQQEALQETKDFDNIAVYHDMGLGKTFTGSEMMKRFGCKVNLIVCQKSKVQDWVEHFTDNYQMQVFDLTNKKQLGEYHGLSQGQRFFIVGVINYELAWRRKELLDLYDFTLMLDESSLIQNQKAKQTKFILKMKPAQVEETDLQVIESTVPDVLKAITDITVQKKKLEEQEKLMKEKLLQAMEEHSVKSFENAKVKFMYVAPTTRTTIDSKKLKADHPDIAEAYSKTSNVSASVRITVK